VLGIVYDVLGWKRVINTCGEGQKGTDLGCYGGTEGVVASPAEDGPRGEGRGGGGAHGGRLERGGVAGALERGGAERGCHAGHGDISHAPGTTSSAFVRM
jgi:hypothetical protein